MSQKIICGYGSHNRLNDVLKEIGCGKFLLVCDGSFNFLSVKAYFDALPIEYIVFDEFKSNPLYEDVCKGIRSFKDNGCDAIVAVGGGSAIDVAKCIKLFSGLDSSKNYLEQEYRNTEIPLVAIPSTAGTGSESTRFAVIYFEGKKQSVMHECMIPNYAILDHSILKTLPLYQKKCTMLDALCQGIESWWSVNSGEESKKFSEMAVRKIIENKDAYLNGSSEEAAEQVMFAANCAGRAINITQTTAAHAMSYKLTSIYKLPHGHAVAICLPKVWRFMSQNYDKCIDVRGKEYLEGVFHDIAAALGASSVFCAIENFERMLNEMGITNPEIRSGELEILASSVNTARLSNNPVSLSKENLISLYGQISKIS